MCKQFFVKFIVLLITVLSIPCYGQGPEEYVQVLTQQLDTVTDPHLRIDIKIQIEEAKYNLDAEYWKSMAKEAQAARHPEAQAKCLNNIGFIYSIEGRREEAIEYYHSALDIYRAINSGPGMAGVYNDLGGIYSDINEPELALEYYQTSHAVYSEVNDSVGMSMTAHNISAQFLDAGDFKMAKYYALISLEIANGIGDLSGMPSILQNLGGIVDKEGNSDSALVLFKQGYEISNSIGMVHGVAHMGISIGEIYLRKYQADNSDKNFLDSVAFYFSDSYRIGKDLNNSDLIKNASYCLMRYYATIQDWKNAYSYTIEYYSLKDTIDNAENQKEILRSQMEYTHSIQKIKDEEERKAEQIKASEKAAKQFYIILSAGFVVVILIVFVFFIVRKWKETQRQNVIIEHQKMLVEEKQKEITDSINYAQRLQRAILATPSEISNYLPQNFLIYQPKDIVAGDFYFFEANENHIFIAAADCTGHGVPGALVSVVCSNALTRCVMEFKMSDPGKILDKTRELINETFRKSGSDVRDGMDISFCSINRKDATVVWAGANNPLWYFENDVMQEIKPDKQPVGHTEKPKPFTSHSLKLGHGTLLFLFTDGIADQFGGPKGKKFKYKSFQNILVKNASAEMTNQKNAIEKAFQNWKGELEQVDDVCVIGIRL